MNGVAKALVIFVVVFHFLAFILEAFLWMRPGIYETVLGRLTDSSAVSLHEQAQILKRLFVNQGFYNLFLALAGVTGLTLWTRGNVPAGKTLVNYMCLSALGAGVVLMLSTRAYVGAVLQAGPAALALATQRRGGSATRA